RKHASQASGENSGSALVLKAGDTSSTSAAFPLVAYEVDEVQEIDGRHSEALEGLDDCPVSHEADHELGPAERSLDLDERCVGEAGQLRRKGRHVRLDDVEPNQRIACGSAMGNRNGGTFAQVVDVGLEREPENRDRSNSLRRDALVDPCDDYG